MKTAAEYLALAQASLPTAQPETLALVAIDLALTDAEKYRILLLRAVRNSLPVALRQASEPPADGSIIPLSA